MNQETIYEELRGKIYRFVRYRLNLDDNDADDLTQQTMLEIWNRQSKGKNKYSIYNEDKKYRNGLVKLIHRNNQRSRMIRGNPPRPKALYCIETVKLAGDRRTNEFDENVCVDEWLEFIQKNGGDRTMRVAELLFWGCSIGEIQAILGISRPTLNRSIKTLQSIIKINLDDE